MPARTNATPDKPTGTVPAKRFELPALDFQLASLTEGTDIPPPLPEPVREAVPTPPETPNAKATKAATNGKHDTSPSPGSDGKSSTSPGGTKRPAEDHPSSPTLSSRPSSIRRLFSRNLLNNAYANGEDPNPEPGSPRPDSKGSVVDSKKAKRSSGWFSRLRSSESTTASKRSSLIMASPTKAAAEEKKATGPPPPMIPELSELKSKLNIKDDAILGSDLFKDIK